MEAFSFFDSSDRPVLATDENGFIVYLNRLVPEALEYAREEMLGQALTRFLCGDRGFSAAVRKSRPLTLLSKSGSRRVRGFHAVKGNGGWLLMPGSGRGNSFAAGLPGASPDARSRKDQILLGLYGKACEPLRLDEFVDSVKDALTGLYRPDGILFYLFSEARDKMLYFSSQGFDKKYIDEISVLGREDGILSPLFTGRRSAQGDAGDCRDSALQGLFRGEGFRHCQAFSILFHQKLMGCLILLERNGPLDPGQFPFILSVCDVLSIVINNFILSEKHKQNYMELLNLQNQLTEEKVAAESDNRTKNKFIAIMSHEIRTPLNGILGFLDLLYESGLSPEQKTYAENARNASTTLLSLINDVLDISKIKSGGLVLENIPFDLPDVLEKVFDFHRSLAREKGLFLRLHVDRSLPRYVGGDPTRFKEVLNNLVSNAVKFTTTGGIDVFAGPASAARDTVTVKFSVKDTGIGIPKSTLRNLFKPYTQADSSTTRKYGGTGLGLSICKELVEHMGGTIQVKSLPGVGSEFSFTVIFSAVGQAGTPPGRPSESSALPPGDGFAKNVRVLLAEDNEINRRLFVLALKKSGCLCDAAANGAEAVRLAAKNDYDIIFMDCLMPEMDGYAATARIRQMYAGGKHTVIVALTASSAQEDRKRCMEAGMDDYLCKPLRDSSLTRIIRKYRPAGPGE